MPTSADAPPRRAAKSAATAAVLGQFVVTLDALIVNVTLPSIRADLGGGLSGLQWVVSGYTLMFAALLLSSGALSDRFGARRAFSGGTIVFVLASAACGLATSVPTLVAARLVQGSAAAIIVPTSMAIIRQAFPDAGARAQALAMWALGGSLASLAGPILGGLLDTVSWRLVFLVNLPVGAVLLWLLARADPSPHRPAPFDWLGQVTAVLAMGGLTYGAIETGAAGITAPRVLIAFAVAVVSAAVFVAAEARGAHPMVPLDLVRTRSVALLIGVGFAYMIGYFGMPFVMSLYLQQTRGLSALATGALFVPMMLCGAVLTPFWPRFASRVGRKAMISGGLTLLAVGLLGLGLLPTTVPVWTLALMMVPIGVAGPLVMPATTAVLLDSVPARQAGTVSGVFNTSRQLGGALAVAVFGTLLATPSTFTRGVHLSLLLAAAIVIASIPAALSLRLSRAATSA